MSTFLSVYSIVLIFGVGIVCFFLQVIMLPLTWPFDRNRVIVGRIYRRAAIVITQLIPMWRFQVAGERPKKPRGNTIVVSNHASQADPFLISRLPWEMKWMGKRSLFSIPFVGWSMWLAGDIPVDRSDRTSGANALAQCKNWLQRNMPVIIFPEGTRSKTAELLPFKDGAFRLALETGADILPIAVVGTETALPKHSWRFGKANAKVIVGSPIQSAGQTVETLKAAARAQIEELRKKLRG